MSKSPLGRVLRGAGIQRSGDALSIDQWMNYFSFNNVNYPFGTGSGNYSLSQKADEVDNSFPGYANGLYRSNGIVFACIGARHRLFTEARFQFRQIKNGRPGTLFGTQALAPLETPWRNGTTSDLLGRALQDVDICGNFFGLRTGRLAQPSTGTIVSAGDIGISRLRPDWVTVIAGSDNRDPAAAEVLGYAYTHGGIGSGNDPVVYGVEQVMHWTPTPDPMANWLGMSWLTPVITEIMADGAAMTHKLKFFEHGGTPNLIVTVDPQVKKDQFDMWVSKFKQGNEGLRNAYKTMFLGGGSTAQVVGSSLQQMDFKTVQGHGETRIASAAGVPPIIVGLSEGLEAATYSLPYDGSVWTCDGPRAIGDIRPGDHIWTQVDGKILRRQVTWQGKTGENFVYTVKTKNRTFRATGNHPVLMPDGSWRNVEDLTTNDRLIAPLGLPDLDGDTLPNGEPATADVLQWLGAFTGDGCFGGRGAVTMCMPPNDRAREHYIGMPAQMFTKAHSGQYVAPGRRANDDLTPRMVELREEGLTFRQIRDEMGLSMHPMSVRDRVHTATREYVGERSPVVVANIRNAFRFNSTEAVAWHYEMGVTGDAKSKRVPSWVFGLREDLRLAYLAGIVDTDGSIAKNGTLVIQFANRALVEDVRMLLVSCGIQCGNIAELFYTPANLPNPGNCMEYRAWRLTASAALEVARIPFADTLYRHRVDANLHRYRPNMRGSYKIVSIERGRVIQPVYDIEVEGGGHTFLADGVVVHNSNYGQARRAFADGTMRPLWRGFCSAAGSIIDAPTMGQIRSELWYDTRDIAFLQEDQTDAINIQQTKATTIHTLVTAGFTPDSVIAAVESEDYTLLEHTGMYSVQLLPAGTVSEGKGSLVTGTGVPSKDAPATDPNVDDPNSESSSSKPAASGANAAIDTGRVVRALLAAKT